MVTNADPQRQFGGPAVLADSQLHQPVGISVAVAAAADMTRALGATQLGPQGYQALGSDPLTLHLAKMSRIQLNEIMSELKAIATENKEQARKFLLAFPNLTKAIFQAQVMLGMIIDNTTNATDGQQGLQQVPPSVPGLPPLPQNMQFNGSSQAQETHFTGHPSSSIQSQHIAPSQFPAHN